MKLKLTYALLALLTAVSFTSCSNDDDNGTNQQPIYYFQAKATTNFVYVKDLAAGTTATYPGSEQLIVFDMNTNTCSIAFSGLKYTTGDAMPFTIANVPLRSYSDPNVMGAEYSDPLTTTGSAANLSITNFKISVLLDPNRTFGVDDDGNKMLAGPQAFISFVIDGRYDVTVVQNKQYFYGTTSSVNPSGNFAPFISKAPKYEVALNYTTGKAQLTIENAKFLEGMPDGITMEFPGIDFTMTDNGLTLSGTDITPRIPKRGEMPAYKASTISGTVTFGNRLDLSFTCPTVPIPMTGTTTYSFTVTVNAPYSLTGGL